MKRRNFVQSLLVVPAAAVAAEQATIPPPASPPAPPPTPAVRATQGRGPQNVPKLTTVTLDSAAETTTGFFTPAQYSTLNKLAEILVPSIKGHPGALDTHAPEFLDFLIARSPANRQKLYRDGLDGLNTAAKKKFHKSFSELDAKQADTLIRPLLVARAWDREEPKDAMQHFVVEVHSDLRQATMNSAEWASSAGSSGRGRFNSGRRMYWKPIDPRVGG